jgi:hypothetical protein
MVGRMTDHLIAVGTFAVKTLDWPPVHMHIADDFASTSAPLFSPATYERVFLPNLKKMVDAFHALGFRISYESEGNVYPMLDLLDASGVDGLAFMEPRESANAWGQGSSSWAMSATRGFCRRTIGQRSPPRSIAC